MDYNLCVTHDIMPFSHKWKLGPTQPIRIPLSLHTHVLHMMEMYDDLCVTHGHENVLHMAHYIEDKLSSSIEKLRE